MRNSYLLYIDLYLEEKDNKIKIEIIRIEI